jgi:DNA-binding NarL/FixJ family response regulator
MSAVARGAEEAEFAAVIRVVWSLCVDTANAPLSTPGSTHTSAGSHGYPVGCRGVRVPNCTESSAVATPSFDVMALVPKHECERLPNRADVPSLHRGGGSGMVLPMAPISVLAVDDHRVFADALAVRLSAERDLEPVTVAYSVAEAGSRLSRTPVDVAIVDYSLGDGTGTELAERLRQLSPNTRVVILTAAHSIEAVVDGLSAGVRAWLPKTVDTAHLIDVIRGVHAGEMWLAPALLGAVMPVLLARSAAPPPDLFAVLTQREREVLDCMVAGLNRDEIANRLGVSGNTVRTHTQNLTGKLGVHSSLQAVTLALRLRHYPAPSA